MSQSSGANRSRHVLREQVSDAVRGQIVQRGRMYWESKRHAGRIPARREVDPLDIPDLLPHIVLLDVAREPWDFRFRLIGTNIVFHLARDWTGTWMSDIAHMAPPSDIFSACVNVAQSGEPLENRTPYVGPHADFLTSEDVILPLAADGETVNMLLVFVEYFQKA